MDLNKITVFIAGSTHSPWVNQAKRAIKELQLDMRHKLESEYNMALICTDCDNPMADNNQKIYNAQIKDGSDIFVLLVDKAPVGPYSMEELIRACVYKEEVEHPKVYVFFAEHLKDDPYIVELRDVIKTMTNRYSDYADDLEFIKKKIDKVVSVIASNKKKQREALRLAAEEEARRKQQAQAEEAIRKQQAQDASRRQRLRQVAMRSMLALTTFLLIVGACLASYFYVQHENSTPIFYIGSGSVKSYLDTLKIDVSDRNDGMYIHIPTGYAWVFLSEEQKNGGNTSSRRAFPIVFAADSINMKELNIKNAEAYLEDVGHIADMVIGYDSMYVTVPTDPQILAPLRPYLKHYDEGAITASELARILVHFKGSDSLCVYHTAPSSGTVATYAKAMIDAAPDIVDTTTVWCWQEGKGNTHQEYDKDTKITNITIKRRPFVILQSVHYNVNGSFVDKGQNNGLEPETTNLRLLNAENKHQAKELRLYFVLRNNGNNIFSIDTPVYKFLTTLVKAIPERKYNLKREYKIVDSSIVIPFDKLSKE